MKRVLFLAATYLAFGCATETETRTEAETGPSPSPEEQCYTAKITVGVGNNGLTIAVPPIYDAGPTMGRKKICWSVDNQTGERILVELADFIHSQYGENELSGKYLDPLDEDGDSNGVKAADVGERANPDEVRIRTKVRKMKKDALDYQGCYNYTIYVSRWESGAWVPWDCEDPELEYDDGGAQVDVNKCAGAQKPQNEACEP